MKTYALVGKSGTGKSYQAAQLCSKKNIEAIIDDGLYIFNTEVLAGKSAKRQATKIGAIKTALFHNEEHRKEVAEKIKESCPKSILLIGTSDGMVEKIHQRLEVPEISETVYIEEITTEEQRKTAYKQRKYQGKHVIPAPTFQLKRQFSGYFMDPLRIFKDWGLGKELFQDKSVVRPTYSYLGDYSISDRVLSDIVKETAHRAQGVAEVSRVSWENHRGGLSMEVTAVLDRRFPVVDCAKEWQRECGEMVAHMTAFHIEQMNIEIKELV